MLKIIQKALTTNRARKEGDEDSSSEDDVGYNDEEMKEDGKENDNITNTVLEDDFSSPPNQIESTIKQSKECKSSESFKIVLSMDENN
jgi:hypothetical protein